MFAPPLFIFLLPVYSRKFFCRRFAPAARSFSRRPRIHGGRRYPKWPSVRYAEGLVELSMNNTPRKPRQFKPTHWRGVHNSAWLGRLVYHLWFPSSLLCVLRRARLRVAGRQLKKVPRFTAQGEVARVLYTYHYKLRRTPIFGRIPTADFRRSIPNSFPKNNLRIHTSRKFARRKTAFSHLQARFGRAYFLR